MPCKKTLPAKAHIVALDSAGQELSSQDFAKALAAWSETGKPALCFVIGGANGLTPAFCQKADTHLSLGQATWSHELARIMLLEQLWRGVALLANHPYASK